MRSCGKLWSGSLVILPCRQEKRRRIEPRCACGAAERRTDRAQALAVSDDRLCAAGRAIRPGVDAAFFPVPEGFFKRPGYARRV